MGRTTQKLLVAAIALCLFLSAIFYYYNNIKIPRVKDQVEHKIRLELDESVMTRRPVAVVTNPNGISHYTVLTDAAIEESITIMEIPDRYVIDEAIFDLSLIKGMITKHPLRYGQQLVLDQFYSEESWYGEYDRLKEFEVVSLVADQVKTGNIIDVVVNYGNGDYDVVVPKTKVHKIVVQQREDYKEPEYTVVLAVDEIEYRNLHLASALGDLETRLYIDVDQPPSIITFNYHERLKDMRINRVSDKNRLTNDNGEENSIGYPNRDDQ